MNRLTAALVVGLVLLLHASEASAKWTRLSTPHFTFIGDVSEGDLKVIAQRLEQFREVIGLLFSDRATSSPVPIVVYVFGSDRSYEPFRTTFQGKPVSSSGYVTRGGDANFMALNVARGEDGFSTLFYDYTHIVLANTVGDIPLWASVGLAEFYESFESRSGGRTAIFGGQSASVRAMLRANPGFIAIGQLIAIDENSPLYMEGERRNAFFAESWTLVHYLMVGSPQRKGQLNTFLAALSQGADGADAFALAFGKDNAALENDLRDYPRRLTLTGVRVDFNEKVAGIAAAPGQAISDAEAGGYLGDLLAHINRVDDARVYLKKAIDGGGASPRAVAALGRLELVAGNNAAALALLDRAAKEAPNMPEGLAWYGRALLGSPEGAVRQEAIAMARTALARAYELEPNNMATASELARAELTSRSDAARAVELLQKAVAAAPGREDYKLLLAYALIERGDYAAALNHLGPIVGRTKRADIKDEARRLLARAAAGSNAARRAADANAAPPAAANGAAPKAGPTGSPAPGPARLIVLDLRTMLAGETRALGLFSAVECAQGSIVLQIDTDSGPVKIAAANFDAIEFITYRQESPGSVECGPQRPPVRTLATFRTEEAPVPGSDTRNRAVAIELLPDGYVPR